MKKQLRGKLLAVRRKLNSEFVITQSDNMAQRLFLWPFYQRAKVVMLFLSMPDEPQMTSIMDHSWREGKTVCVPNMRQEFGLMDAAIIDNREGLIRGRYNLLVPDPAYLSLIDPEKIDLIIVPAVAYDAKGNRLGMGAGYYDRFIPRATQAVLVGAIWSSNIIDDIPIAEYDKPVQYLLTENGIMHCDAMKEYN